MSKYRFGLIPKGMGYDCYRTHELLLLGVIPIIEMRRTSSHKLFEGLPVIQMEHLDGETTRKDIVDAITNYVSSDSFKNNAFDGWEKLFLRHQRRLIVQDTKREKDVLVDEQGDECYQAFRYSVIGNNSNAEPIFCSKEGNCEQDLSAQINWDIPTL